MIAVRSSAEEPVAVEIIQQLSLSSEFGANETTPKRQPGDLNTITNHNVYKKTYIHTKIHIFIPMPASAYTHMLTYKVRSKVNSEKVSK